MILSGPEIQKRRGTDIFIDPFDPSRINPNSYNLSLHKELLAYTNPVLDMSQPNPTRSLTIPPEGLLLEANRVYLGRTVEHTETHNLVPMLEGRFRAYGRQGRKTVARELKRA